MNNNEVNTYVNGLGFYEKSPQQKEKKNLIMQYNLILFSMLMYISLTILLERPIMIFMSMIGFDIRENTITRMILMSEAASQVLKTLVVIFSVLITFFIILFLNSKRVSFKRLFKIPTLKSTLYTVFIMLGVMVIADILTSMFNGTINNLGLYILESKNVVPQNGVAFIIMSVHMIVIVPFLEELLFRGIILKSLRLFGDITAIVVTTVIYSVITQSFDLMVYNFIIGLALAYFAVKTDSFIATFFASVVMHSFIYLKMIIELQNRNNGQSDVYAIIILLFIICLLAFTKYIIQDKTAFKINNFDTALTNRTKIKLFFLNLTFCFIFIIAVVRAVGMVQMVG